MKNPFLCDVVGKKDLALLRSSTRCTQYELKQGMQYFISQLEVITARTFLIIIIIKILTEIEVQTVTFIEAKNDFGDWVCDLVWEPRCIPF